MGTSTQEYFTIGGALRWTFRKWDVRTWTGSSWFRLGTGGGHL